MGETFEYVITQSLSIIEHFKTFLLQNIPQVRTGITNLRITSKIEYIDFKDLVFLRRFCFVVFGTDSIAWYIKC